MNVIQGHMKKAFFIISIGFGLSLVTSCGDLYLEDPNNMPENSFWKTERDALMGLGGIFDAYQSRALMGRKYREFDHITDNAYRVNASGGWNDIDNDTHNASTRQIIDFWTNFYNVGARANEVIAKIEQIPASAISESSKKRIIAEAAFLRAYAYHDLTAIWGDIPIYLDALKPFDPAVGPTSRAEVINYFVKELEEMIIPNLPVTIPVTEKGRIPRGAAQALLGKFYLLAKEYKKASDAFWEVINSKQYELYPDYGKLFTEAGEFSSESLFEINFIGSALDQGEIFSSRVDTTLAPIIPTGYWTPIANLANSYLCADGKPIANSPIYGTKSPLYNATGNNKYLNRDPRLRASIYTSLDVNSRGEYIWGVDTRNANTIANSMAVKKYSIISSQQYENDGPQNYYVIRYAEVLLSYAEAKNEYLGAPDQSIHDAVNAIRDRVKMPHYPATLSKEQMRQYIRDERRWEFALEHQRFFDLKRWNLLLTLPPAANNNKKASEPRVYSWPYPQSEMDRNPKLRAYGQNEGY